MATYGTDPRGRAMTQGDYQRQRFGQQQGPAVSEFARQFGRGSEANYADYGDIMKRYGHAYDTMSGAGRGNVSAERVGYTDPFESHAGYKEFSQTGGYSPSDIANMRARGVSPIRAAYANAQREVGRQRSLQGGYSPNATATLAKMAREQGQSGADAVQNVEAGLAQARNQGRLAGLGGMAGIEGQRLGAQLQAGTTNAELALRAGMFNAEGDNELNRNRLEALRGMTSLYGTTPAMAQLFGDQMNTSIGQGGNIGLGQQQMDIAGQGLTGRYDQTLGRIGDVADIYGTVMTNVYPWLRNRQAQQQPQQNIFGGMPSYTPTGNVNNPYQTRNAPTGMESYQPSGNINRPYR